MYAFVQSFWSFITFRKFLLRNVFFRNVMVVVMLEPYVCIHACACAFAFPPGTR